MDERGRRLPFVAKGVSPWRMSSGSTPASAVRLPRPPKLPTRRTSSGTIVAPRTSTGRTRSGSHAHVADSSWRRTSSPASAPTATGSTSGAQCHQGRSLSRTDASALFVDPAHQAAQPSADLFDGVRRGLFAVLRVLRATRLVLGDPFLRERAVLDLGEDPLHLLLGAVVDDPRG